MAIHELIGHTSNNNFDRVGLFIEPVECSLEVSARSIGAQIACVNEDIAFRYLRVLIIGVRDTNDGDGFVGWFKWGNSAPLIEFSCDKQKRLLLESLPCGWLGRRDDLEDSTLRYCI